MQLLRPVVMDQPGRAIRLRTAFAALIVVQAAHSLEEYVGRLYESFPPARWVSGAISSNLERGFVMANMVLVAFGLWSWLWLVRRGYPRATGLIWFWVAIELANGIGHPLSSLQQGGYTPGVATAPLLFVLALVVSAGHRTAIQLERYQGPRNVHVPGKYLGRGVSLPNDPRSPSFCVRTGEHSSGVSI